MLNGLAILIVEDEPLVALDLAEAVLRVAGRPVGPVPTVAEALELLKTEDIEAAILDANLTDRDVTPLALALIGRGVPFIVHTGTGLPEELARQYPGITVVPKPARSTRVLAALLQCVSPDRAKFE